MKFIITNRLSLIIPILLAGMLLTSCRNTHEKVVQRHPNGSPMLVYLYTGSENDPTRVGERMYYDNGQLQLEKHFSGKPEKPSGTWNYYFDNGQLFASADFDSKSPFGRGWVFYNRNGGNYYSSPFDSVYVTDMGMFGTPSTVVFCAGNNQDVIQFYSNYTVRSTERLTEGRRNGRVIFYYPNGNPQTEANFTNGVEEGDYTVYYESGIPYYRGTYTNGQRTGIWEFYDREGNLAETKDFTPRH